MGLFKNIGNKLDAMAKEDYEIEKGIEQRQQSTNEIPARNIPVALNQWICPTPQAYRFDLCGSPLIVSQELDKYNQIRRQFANYANACVTEIRNEYDVLIHDYDSFSLEFPSLYMGGLNLISAKAIEALFAEGIFSMTADMIAHVHLDAYSSALDEVAAIANQLEAISDQNANGTFGGKLLNQLADQYDYQYEYVFSTGSAFQDAARDARMANRNMMNSLLVDGVRSFASRIKPEQIQAVYNSIDKERLMYKTFMDYVNMSMVVSRILSENGNMTTWLMPPSDDQVQGILQNVANPNFPRNQLPQVFVNLMLFNPYSYQIQSMLLRIFGNTPEVNALRQYFCF